MAAKLCNDCGRKIRQGNASGYCRFCKDRHRKHTVGRTCPDCGKLISPYSSRCKPCSNAYRKSLPKVCNICGAPGRIKGQVYCKDCYADRRWQRYQRYYTSTQREYMHAEPTGEIGKCRLCHKEFALVRGQHSSLHWCPSCQDTPAYQNYASEQAWLTRMTPNI